MTVMRDRGQVTIPADIREAAHLEPGDPIEFELVENGVLLRPQKVIDSTQAWFWTDVWQRSIRASLAEQAAGRGEQFDSDEAFLGALEDED